MELEDRGHHVGGGGDLDDLGDDENHPRSVGGMQFECDENGQCRIINLGGKYQPQQQQEQQHQQKPQHHPRQSSNRDPLPKSNHKGESGERDRGAVANNNDKNGNNDDDYYDDDGDASDNPLLSLLDDRSPVAKQSDNGSGLDDGDDEGGGGVNLRVSNDIRLDIQSMKMGHHG